MKVVADRDSEKVQSQGRSGENEDGSARKMMKVQTNWLVILIIVKL